MPESTVNPQITDAVTQSDTISLGTAIPFSAGVANIMMAKSIGMLMMNAVSTYHNAKISESAATTMGSAKILQDAGSTPGGAGQSSEQLIKRTAQLANQAIAMMNPEDDNYQANKAALESLVTKLKDTAVKTPASRKKTKRK